MNDNAETRELIEMLADDLETTVKSPAPIFVWLDRVAVNVNAIVSIELVEEGCSMLLLSGGHREFVPLDVDQVFDAIRKVVTEELAS